jgi:hypothetical protein
VLQLRGELDLAQKSLGTDDRGHFGAHQFERYEAVVAEVAGEQDEPHAAASELSLECEAVPQGVSQHRRRDSHGVPARVEV